MNPKQQALLLTLADQLTEPAVAGAVGLPPLKPRQLKDWNRVSKAVATHGETTSPSHHRLACQWKKSCQSVGIGAGWLSFLFWRWVFPLLIELAKRWIEAQQREWDRER